MKIKKQVKVSDHSALTNLEWSATGHIMDDDITFEDGAARSVKIDDARSGSSADDLSLLGGNTVFHASSALDGGDVILDGGTHQGAGTVGDVKIANTRGIGILADGSKLVTSAAPTADAEIANKKYVDDNAGGVFSRSATQVVAASDSKDTTNADLFCDGTDDDVQIQAAIDALPATGGLVKLMDGTYNITTKITVLKSDVTLAGCGRNTILFQPNTTNITLLEVSDNTRREGFRLTNLRLDGNRANNTGSWDGINLRDIFDVTIDNCWIDNCGSGVFGYAIDAPADGPEHFIITNNHFLNCGSGTIGGGIKASFMVKGTISHNTFDDCTNYNIDAPSSCTIIGNIFNNGVDQIISPKESTIIGNYATGATDFISGAEDHTNIIGNHAPDGTIKATGDWVTIDGNYVELRGMSSTGDYCTINGNTLYRTSSGNSSIKVTGNNTTISGNTINDDQSNNAAIYVTGSSCSITGNVMTKVDREGIEISGGDHCIITGNSIKNCSEDTDDTYSGILLTGTSTYNVVSNNRVLADAANKHKYGIREAAAGDDHNLIQGNILSDAVTADISTQGIHTQVKDNITEDHYHEQKLLIKKNTSGGALAAGDIVVLKAVAAGDEVTTTTAQGDDMVFGMTVDTINNDAYGLIKVLGKTTTMKVDGTTDIAIGDFIGTFTTAKIGMKAAAGDMAIAIALEGYTTDDSSGVIDALLITPRKI